MKNSLVQQILQESHDGYDKIAEHFSETRKYNWEELKHFVTDVKKGDKVLDAGCGNGRLLDLLKAKGVDYWGLDNSKKLLELAQKGYPGGKYICSDIAETDFPAGSFDIVFCIAVLHHIPSHELRIKVVKNLAKGLKEDGKLYLTVWNLYQDRYYRYVKKAFWDRLLGKSEMDAGDCRVPWKTKTGQELVSRYVHAFELRELQELIENAGLKVEEVYYSKNGERSDKQQGHNLCVVASK